VTPSLLRRRAEEQRSSAWHRPACAARLTSWWSAAASWTRASLAW